MKIVCPSCHAHYDVPEAVVTSRRKMRCARCSGEWMPADLAAPEPPPPLPPSPLAKEIMADKPAFVTEVHEGSPAPAPAPANVDPLPLMPSEQPAHEDESATMAVPEPAWQAPALAPPVATEPDIIPEPPPLKARRSEPRVSVEALLHSPAATVEPPVLAWAASIALVLGLVAAAVIFRAPIMKAWPPSARLFAGLGEK